MKQSPNPIGLNYAAYQQARINQANNLYVRSEKNENWGWGLAGAAVLVYGSSHIVWEIPKYVSVDGLDYFDPAAATGGDLSAAFQPANADFMLMSFTSDWRFAPARSREIVKALHDNDLNVSYAEIESSQGHDAFLLKIPQYVDVFSAYVERMAGDL